MLDEAQERLEKHFSSLHDERAGLGYPVYALEHGLDPSEIDALREALCGELVGTGALQRKHWLLWVVIAAEVGYAYDGDEYWITFARGIPDWRRLGNRETIRSWFRKFADTYAGFRPSGRWAEHFSIIAWPIAHAILPKDLQGVFAKALYNLRYDLARGADLSLAETGSLLQSRAADGPSRFENLLEQTDLTARLVLALRDEDVQDAVAAIHRPTLVRIVADLERRQEARDWLRDARRVMREARVSARGNLVRSPGSATIPGNQTSRPGGARLVARQASDAAWRLGIALPDLAGIVGATGLPAKTLDQTRVRFADRTDAWMPGRALATLSLREHPIAALGPFADGPALRLEREIQPLAALISSGVRIAGAFPWLLRIHEDRIARQVMGNHVRAGQEYVLVAKTPVAEEALRGLSLQTQESKTADAILYRLSIPRTLGAAQLQALTSLKLGHALRVLIEPVGLVPRWEGAAIASAWLPNEEPVLRLSADCPVKEFTVCVDGREWTRIPAINRSEILISLGALSIGSHVLDVGGTVRASSSAEGDRRLEPERLFLDVRSPRPWTESVSARAGFCVSLAPAGVSLDSVVNGKASISIVGPPERGVALELRTFDLNGHPSGRTELGRVMLPANDVSMRRLVLKLGKEPLAERVQSSPRVDLAFVVDELGVSALSFVHKVKPLRWKLESSGRVSQARLIDERGSDQPIEVYRYDIRVPDKREKVNTDECLAGLPVASPGVLLAASLEKVSYPALISAPPQTPLTSFGELEVDIKLSMPSDTARLVGRFIALHRLWKRAQPLGALATIRKATVLEVFEHRMAALLCGRDWAYRAHKSLFGSARHMERLQVEVAESRGFAARLRSTNWNRVLEDPSRRAEFVRLAGIYKISEDEGLCQLALQIAFNPDGVRLQDPQQGATLFERLAEFPSLARGAYFARLLTDLAARDTIEAA